MTSRLQTVDEIISWFARGVLSFPLIRHTWGAFSVHYCADIVFSMVSDVYLDSFISIQP